VELRLALPRPLLGKDILNAFNLACGDQKKGIMWECFRINKESYFQYAPGKIDEVIVAQELRAICNIAEKMFFFNKPVWFNDADAPIISIQLENERAYTEVSFEISKLAPQKLDEFMALFFGSLHVFCSCPMK